MFGCRGDDKTFVEDRMPEVTVTDGTVATIGILDKIFHESLENSNIAQRGAIHLQQPMLLPPTMLLLATNSSPHQFHLL